jgi:hypothetical protein
MHCQMEQRTRAHASASPSTLFFVHIPKTAGMTFQAVLSQVYDEESFCAVYPSWEGAKDEIKSMAGNARLRAVAGHFYYGLHLEDEIQPFIENDAQYATFLRDPVHRVVSQYNHVMNSDDPLHREIFAAHPTLESFLAHPWARDMQVCFLTGWDRVTIKSDKRAAVRAANELLRDRFAVVGLTERFDESLVLFADAFGWRLPTYTSTNLASERARQLHVEDLAPSLVDRIKNFNQCDIPILEYARSVFDVRRSEIPSFQSKLSEYRSRQA